MIVGPLFRGARPVVGTGLVGRVYTTVATAVNCAAWLASWFSNSTRQLFDAGRDQRYCTLSVPDTACHEVGAPPACGRTNNNNKSVTLSLPPVVLEDHCKSD